MSSHTSRPCLPGILDFDISSISPSRSRRASDDRTETTLKALAPYGHLHGIKRILHDIVGIQLVDLAQHCIAILLHGFGEEKKLDTGEGLKALQTKVLRLDNLDAARGLGARVGFGNRGDGHQACRDGVDPACVGSCPSNAEFNMAASLTRERCRPGLDSR